MIKICSNDKVYKNHTGKFCYLDSYGEETCFDSAQEMIEFIEKDLPLSLDEKDDIKNL